MKVTRAAEKDDRIHRKGKESTETQEKVRQRQVKVDAEDKETPKGKQKREESGRG